ncbi:MAG: hypothetical protein RLZZ135_1993 [Cyanobacteriota bacterium]
MEQAQAYWDGVKYLDQISAVLPDLHMVDVMANLRDRVSICTWIGKSIGSVNLQLRLYLQACHECFNEIDRRSIQIFAVPFATSVRLDGFCNIEILPTTILVDVGRVEPTDWLALVAHEYAHAHLGVSGHNSEYAKILSHLCLGLGLPNRSSIQSDIELYYWPPYQPVLDPLKFWRGESHRV